MPFGPRQNLVPSPDTRRRVRVGDIWFMYRIRAAIRSKRGLNRINVAGQGELCRNRTG